MNTQPSRDPAIWLFDEECVLCSSAVQFTLRHERAPSIRFVAIRSPEGRRFALDHGIDPDCADTFLFVEKGRVLARSDGVAAWAGHLHAPWSWLRFIRLLPSALRDSAYSAIARNRYKLFGRRRCLAPSAAQRARFVLPPDVSSGAAT